LQRISEQTSVVADFETGRAVMNHAILNKIEKALGTKVR
jgi:ribosome-binding protein aMBF1 (putative translation factor)